MTYNAPVRLALRGDRRVAERYIRTGRTLLFKAMRAAGASGAVQGRQSFKVDNVTIDVLFAGEQAAIVITAPGGAPETFKVEEQFVTWPRDIDHPLGLDALHPQLMHSIKDDEWVTLFYSTEIEGYDEVTVAKGTYRTEKGVEVFPAGVRHAGNIDWRSKDGLRVSWYGPSSRYFYDAYVQARSQYGKHVFMLGQVLLDVEQYIIDSEPDAPFIERWVLGAAVQDNKLFVMHGYLPPDISDDTSMIPPYTAVVALPYASTTGGGQYVVAGVLCTYDLVPTDPVGFAVVPQSREVITSVALPGGFNPWFFNESVTAAVSVGLPQNPATVISNGNIVSPATPTSRVWTLATTGAMSTAFVTLATGDSRGVIACDFKGDELVQLEVVRSQSGDGSDIFELSCGDYRTALLRETMVTPDNRTQTIERRNLKFADLREDLFVTRRFGFNVEFEPGQPVESSPLFTWGVELWHAGRTQFTPTDYNVGSFPDNVAQVERDERLAVATIPLSPSGVMYMTWVGQRNSGLTTFIWVRGMSASYDKIDAPPEALFGKYGVTAGTPLPPTLVSVRFGTAPPTDTDGHFSMGGGAAYDIAAMYSGPVTTLAGHLDVGYAHLVSSPPGTQLPVLSGVGGQKARYHPIWLLGTLPRREV